ncbi:YjdF family protein [Enterococcus sp. AZ103]|uniref:YjdF family protein n=1 Tax=Enterococcus sp. AZ103 TaxID=2774628 RepID=UPI003F29AC1F
MKLTVYFDGTFWCGLVEAQDQKESLVYKHTFGPEPKDQDIMIFIHQQLPKILASSQTVKAENNGLVERKINPKRRQRMINRAKRQPVVSTKSQLALQEVHQLKKKAKQKRQKQDKADVAEAKFQQKQLKKQQKKKGH